MPPQLFRTASPAHMPTTFPTDLLTVFSTVFPTIYVHNQSLTKFRANIPTRLPTDFANVHQRDLPSCSRIVTWSRPRKKWESSVPSRQPNGLRPPAQFLFRREQTRSFSHPIAREDPKRIPSAAGSTVNRPSPTGSFVSARTVGIVLFVYWFDSRVLQTKVPFNKLCG